MTGTILVPLDGSELGERALPWAIRLAQRLGRSLTLVRAVPWPEFPVSGFGGYISPETYNQLVRADHAAATEYLALKQTELSKTGLAVATVMRDGAVAEAIHDVADELGASALVMASHGHGGMKRLVLGSVAERLLGQATIPVLLIRAGEPAAEPALQKILVPVDGSSLGERAIDLALGIVEPDGVLVLERVVEPIYDAVGGGDVATFVLDEDATIKAEDEARRYLERVASSASSRGNQVVTRLHRGRPAAEILSSAASTNPDLIVMTTHGRAGTSRWLAGSVADEVFRNATHPILLVSVRAVVAQVTGAFTVGDLMTRDLEVFRDDEPLISAVRKMLRRRVSGGPVVDASGALVGVVSEYDLLAWHDRALSELVKSESDLDPSQYGRRIEAETVASVMTRPATSIHQDAEMTSGLRLMLDRGLRRLPVTDGDQLVGIISRADILRAMAHQWSSVREGNNPSNEVKTH